MKVRQVSGPRKSNAVAIIITISTIALVAVILVSFLSISRIELKSANTDSKVKEARSYSESATNLVISQIRSATGRISEAWASQPGSIRRWDQTGNFVAGHKLYSDSKMVEDGSELLLSQDRPDPDWPVLKARYVDLNEPAVRIDDDGSLLSYFPIIDPRAAFPEGGGAYQAPGSVEGFGVDINGTTGIVVANDHTARLPMPVEWLYILKDGTIGHLDESNVFVPAGKASEENPIVGRFAFWADDESAKVNINTASEPTFWDVPRTVAGEVNDAGTEPTSEDVWFAKYQPGLNEWQRYPGHPATTSLSTVLFPGELTPENKESIYSIVPRIIGGGSKSGTFWDQRQVIFRIDPRNDQDRLFASTDEILLTPERDTQQYFLPARGESSSKSKNLIGRSQFFITSSSRAPELNIFGLPKMCMWPIDSEKRNEGGHDGNYWLSAADKLFEFVSTTGWDDTNSNNRIDLGENRNSYIYQRVNPNTVSDEWDEPRNLELWNYIAKLTSLPAPGYGGNFAAKYNSGNSFIPGVEGNDRDNLITSTFDYIRITNGLDPYRQAAGQRDFIDGRGQVHPLTKDIGDPKETRGFGRQYSINSVGLAFICTVDPIHWIDSNLPEHLGFTDIKGHENLPEIDHDDDPGTPEVKALPKDRIAIQAAMLIDTGVAMQGWRKSSEDWLHARVAGLQNLKVWGYADANPETQPSWVPLFEWDAQLIDIRDGGGHHGRYWGGNIGIRPWMHGNRGTAWDNNNFRPRPPINGDSSSRGRLRGNVVLIPVDENNPQQARIRFQGGDIEIDMFRAVGDHNFSYVRTGPSHVHTFFMDWPSAEFPRPYLAQASPSTGWGNGGGGFVPVRAVDRSYNGWWHWDPRMDRCRNIPSYPWGDPPPWMRPVGTKFSGDGLVPRDRIGSLNHKSTYTTGEPAAGNNLDGYYTPLQGGILRYGDVVRSLVLTDPSGKANGFTPGDLRLVYGRRVIPKELFRPHVDYFNDEVRMDHILNHCAAGPHYMVGWSNNVPVDQYQIPTVNSAEIETQLTDAHYHFANLPTYPKGIAFSSILTESSVHITTGDFDNGVSLTPDGAYCNKPDDGNATRKARTHENAIDKDIPYLTNNWDDTSPEQALFSPNRQIPSPVMFGSLPTGVKRGLPWQTLLFRPQPNHPNHSTTIPDHLWLDLFWMPIVEPYALSEPLATAGKININTQIVPFSYIERKTGIISLLKAEEMLCVPDELAADYKNWDHECPDYDIPPMPTGLRRKIHIEETLKQWDVKHKQRGELFKTPGEICDIHLVPDLTNGTGSVVPYVGTIAGTVNHNQPSGNTTSNNQIDAAMRAFWEAHSPTGDNSRERPYAHIYPRLTSRSNTFRVHIRAQSIQQPRSAAPDEIDPERLSVLSEYRGSTLIERFIDPNQSDIPDYATEVVSNPRAIADQNLDTFYQFRIVETKRFDP